MTKKILLILPIFFLLATGCNKQSYTSTNSSVTQNTLPTPEAPTITYYPKDIHYVQLTWNYTVADYFNIYRATSLEGEWVKIIANYPGSARAAVDRDLPKGATILYYRITSSDGKNSESSSSNVVSVAISGDTTNWQIYNKVGVNFKYPNDWVIVNDSSNNSTGLNIFLVPKKYKDYHPEGGSDGLSLADAYNTNLEGATNTRVFDRLNVSNLDRGIRIYFTDNSKQFFAVCSTVLDSQTINTCNKIISTFEFTPNKTK